MNKRSILIETMWLIIAVVTLLIAIYETTRKPITETYPLYIIPGISVMMFSLRRTIRKNNNKL